MFVSIVAVLIMTAAMAIPQAAEAQGRGRPKTPKTEKPRGSSVAEPSSPATDPVPDFQAPVAPSSQFGVWLDDASAATAGEGSFSIGVGHWRMTDMSQTNFPMLGAGVGLTDRMQVAASVPFYRTDFQATTARGLDDVYFGAKYTIVDPTLTVSEVGLAIGSVVEVLSAGTPGGRIHFAVPVSVEVRRFPFRFYASGGYFTRGAVFGGGAVEWTAPAGLALTGTITQSYSLVDTVVSDPFAPRQRADVSVGVAHPFSGAAAGYVNVGRSLVSVEQGGTSLALSGGVSLRFRSARSTP
jgi:hypothetical protein